MWIKLSILTGYFTMGKYQLNAVIHWYYFSLSAPEFGLLLASFKGMLDYVKQW